MIKEEDIRLEWNNDRYYVQIGEEIGKEINSEITILSPLPKSDATKIRNEILENQRIVERLKKEIEYWNTCGEFAVDYPDWYKNKELLQSILKGGKE